MYTDSYQILLEGSIEHYTDVVAHEIFVVYSVGNQYRWEQETYGHT